ncbi:ribbon-helix-helix protein, CopG family [Prescottella agglutinans]|uniref:DNA-binding protein n=1 Tax=Prescottella agglutinans TaxID=1644129 RepID=A0ABT6MEV0_9NOCA|nr:putative DNA-binding protein [Prescottella agglutinans]
MSKGTTLRNIRISDELWEAAKLRAEAEGRTVSDVVREALTAYIAHSSRKSG